MEALQIHISGISVAWLCLLKLWHKFLLLHKKETATIERLYWKLSWVKLLERIKVAQKQPPVLEKCFLDPPPLGFDAMWRGLHHTTGSSLGCFGRGAAGG